MDFSDFIIGIVVFFIVGAVLNFLWQLIRRKPNIEKMPNVEKMKANKDVEGLIRTLKDTDRHVRNAAEKALNMIKAKKS